MHPTLIFLRSQELTALNRNEETSFCIVLDKFLFHKKKVYFLFFLAQSLFFSHSF